MGLDTLREVVNALNMVFGGIRGVGAAFVIVGLSILLIIGVGLGIYVLAKAIKLIPKMSVWGFLKFLTITAVVLIVIGIFLP
ncbi:MAG: hypothetical protein QXT88_01455 [Desulfurococcaceae archaeon]